MNLKNIKCYLLDMDGTFYLGNELIEGALEFIKILKHQGKDYIFLTNNSSKNKTAYREKLNKLGCEIEENKIFTSGEATVMYLKKINKNANIYVIGTKFLVEEFKNAGFNVVKKKEKRPDYVVLGFDTTLTYEKIRIGCDFIREGTPFIATHPDLNCPLGNNMFMPDAGSMIEIFKASTGITPLIIGKPYKHIIEGIKYKYNLNNNEIAIVGDRLYTDIKTGQNAGITSVLVLSGETTYEMYNKSEIKADYIFKSIKELGSFINFH